MVGEMHHVMSAVWIDMTTLDMIWNKVACQLSSKIGCVYVEQYNEYI